jgi:DNA-binding response OmpR family regulator
MNVLLVEDDRELARQLVATLSAARFHVEHVGEGEKALSTAMEPRWDVIILDVSLPGLSGFSIVDHMRNSGVRTPVIFLTAKSDISNRIKGLSLGADDYLTKPFSHDELKARLLALVRRSSMGQGAPVKLPRGWTLNPLLREVGIGGETIALMPKEWSLLRIFLEHEGEVLTKSHLLEQVWGISFDPGTNVVDAMVCRLRRKLTVKGSTAHVETLRGRGYVFRSHD